MKNFRVLFIAIAAVLMFSSCKNFENILPRNTGTWNATNGTVRTFEDNVQIGADSTYSFDGDLTYQFNDDGTGVATEDGTSSDFTWAFNSDTEVLTLNQDGFDIIFDVLECSRDNMTLFNEFEIEFFGILLKTETTIDFEKAD